ncbi:MAG: tRNA uridine-5-carboxymethylaminomethyl(34) synthesis GTPase MnmE [Alphaproteobacteria bacterium]|nr:tRNA uridine-5-carboxymethylaminomethyl(34) synthesis GTPase MnmE [Alphaproteobacteria bacterium]
MTRKDHAISDTIFAPASAPGRAGVAIIRISGPKTRQAFHEIAGIVPPLRQSTLRILRDEVGAPIDQALCLYFEGPMSFTGEDVAEFHIHGSPAVLSACLLRLSKIDACRIAEPGEFIRRAFENGKLDLSAVEGLADLIDAETEIQRKQALRQLQGGLTRESDRWRASLIEVLALFDAELDFSDEADVEPHILNRARELLSKLSGEMRDALAHASWGERVREGFVVLLSGPPNSGKSTLLNALAKRDVAIVADRPGTTRDLIEVKLDLKGLPVLVIDSAGIRDAADEIENEGIRRTIDQAQRADIVLWLQPGLGDRAPPMRDIFEAGSPVIEVITQIDKGGVIDQKALAISAKTGQGMDLLVSTLFDQLGRLGNFGRASVLLTRERHRAAVEEALEFIDRAMNSGHGTGVELIAEEIRLAARAIGKITGNVSVDDVLDRLFSSFCIGK